MARRQRDPHAERIQTILDTLRQYVGHMVLVFRPPDRSHIWVMVDMVREEDQLVRYTIHRGTTEPQICFASGIDVIMTLGECMIREPNNVPSVRSSGDLPPKMTSSPRGEKEGECLDAKTT